MLRHIVPDVVENQVLQLLSPRDTAQRAADVMTAHNISAVIIAREGKLAGIITERDLTQKIIAGSLDPKETRIEDFMTTGVLSILPEETAGNALRIMNEKGYRHLPIVDGGNIVGIVSVRDLYAAIKLDMEDDLNETSEYMFGCRRYSN